MKMRVMLTFATLFFLFNSFATAQLMDVGSSIGIDFSNADGSPSNWNTLPTLNAGVQNPTAIDGDTILGVTFSASGATGQNGDPDVSAALTTILPAEAQGDWWFVFGNGQDLVFEFSGLDDGLVYSLTVGCYRENPTAVQLARGTVSWVVNGQTLTTDLTDPVDSYVVFSNLSPVDGVISVRSDDQNKFDGDPAIAGISVVSALRLDATGGMQTLTIDDVTPGDPEVVENPLLFEPTDPQVVDSAQPTDRPNVVVIFADDWGYGDLSVNGATLLKTPNIDRIAAEGRNFSDAHSASGVCTASRYSLYTGGYPFRGGGTVDGPATPLSRLLLDPDQKMIGDVMRDAGYKTSLIGKWHLGFGTTTQNDNVNNDPKWNYELTPGPNDCGFDYYYGVPVVNSAAPYVYVENRFVVGLDPNDPFVFGQNANTESQNDWGGPDRGSKSRVDGYMGGANAAHLLYRDQDVSNHLKQQAKNWITTNKDDPFFMILSTTAIHHPFTPAEEFEGTSLCGIYGDFVHELDYLVGDVVDHLQELGELDNTLLIITSDNGGMGWQTPQSLAITSGHRLNGDFLGYKFGTFEGGHRVPFIARWPGKIPAGTTSDQKFSQVDLMKTLANFLDVSLEIDEAVDSFDVMEVLSGNPSVPVRESMFNHSWREPRGIRMDDWVYIPGRGDGGFNQNIGIMNLGGHVNSDIVNGSIISGAPTTQLYNLAVDPFQEQNVVQDPANANILSSLIDLRAEFLSSDRTAPFVEILLGDVNRDGDVDFLDIAPFIGLLRNASFQNEADVNGDGEVDFLDIGPFVQLLSSQ